MVTQEEIQVRAKTPMFRSIVDVVRVVDITPHMRRVTLGGESLHLLADRHVPGDAIKLYIPEAGSKALVPQYIMLPSRKNPFKVRAYTIRNFHPATAEIDVDVFLHGDTVSSVWARTARAGDQVGFIGPRHDYKGDQGASWQVLAGDESALPAIAAILESLPETSRAYAFIEVTDPSDEVPLNLKAQAAVQWLHRGDVPAKQSRLLEQALRSFAWPDGSGYVWAAGEQHAIKAIRRYLLDERQLPKHSIVTMGYWS